MTAEQSVLVVDSADGTLQAVMRELDDLGFRVIWVPSFDAALEFMAVHSRLALIVASAAAAETSSADFAVRAHQLAPDVRIIWGEHSGVPIGGEELRRAIAGSLAEHFYPSVIANAVEHATLEVLGRVREFKVEAGAFLSANQTALSDLSAVIPFGGGVSGHLMVGMTRASAEILYRAYFPDVNNVRLDRMEDLVGEMCNQILGRINAFFAERAVSVQHNTPIFIRATGSTLRFPGRRPSFALTLSEAQGGARLALEYYLADFDRDRLQEPEPGRILALGEVCFF